MIDFAGKTFANIQQSMLDRIPNTFDKRDTSPIPTALGPAAFEIEGVYIALDQIQRQSFVGTAVGDDLESLAAIGGVSRIPATPAVRLGVFNISVPLGARFSTVNGIDSINFIVTAATDDPLEWWLTAETPGIIGNQYTGAILPITTVPGLNSAAITDIIIDGSDLESDEALRARLISALTEKPFAGNIAAYKEQLIALTEVTNPDGEKVAVNVGAVQVYPTWNGGGTVKCSILGTDYMPASDELVELIQYSVDPPAQSGLGVGFAPIGAQVTISTATPVTISVSATIYHTTGTTMASLQTLIEEAIESYLAEVRKSWGIAESTDITLYLSSVYISRVTAAILGVLGVTNVTGVTINGSASDVVLTESSSVQQLPVLGTVTLTEA